MLNNWLLRKILPVNFLNTLRQRITDWCLDVQTVSVEDFYNNNNPVSVNIPDFENKEKFIGRSLTNDYYVETPYGYSPIKQVLKTIPYTIYHLMLDNGMDLQCADNHIVILEDMSEIFVKDLTTDHYVKTKDGASRVKSVIVLDESANMYDLELIGDNHLFYTGGILSHNTQTISMFLLWHAMFNEDQTILIASKNDEHALEIMDRVRFSYEELPFWLKAGCKFYNQHKIFFENGSRMISQATTEKTGRGYAISKLYLDELAFINPKIQEKMWASLAPTLSTGGSAIISSTPNGDTDLFASLWRGAKAGLNSFIPIFFPWTRHPERNEEYAELMLGQLGKVLFSQEVLCHFISSDALLIDSIKLSYLKSKPPVTENMGFKFWVDQIGGLGKTYMVGIDPATGNGSDYSVIEVVEFPSLIQVAEFRSNVLNVPLLYAKIKWILKLLTAPNSNSRGKAEVFWSFERNGIGEALVALIQNDDSVDGGVYIENVELFNEHPNKLGCYTTGKSKSVTCLQLKNLTEKIQGHITYNSEIILFELQNFVANGTSYAARAGGTDDTVMAMNVIMKVLNRLSSYDERARTIMYESVAPDSDIIIDDENDSYGGEIMPVMCI